MATTHEHEPLSRTYRFAMTVNAPTIRWWGRLEVVGLDELPVGVPLLICGNHDSHWDPVAIGVAGRSRRQICALAKASMWKRPGLRHILDGMGQIPIERGAGDVGALDRATEILRDGACIGIFPEGTLSRGKPLRARSGIGRLALEVPEAHVTLVAIDGTTELTGFPRRPRLRLRFFDPVSGQPRPGEDPGALSARLLSEIRELVPPKLSYRKRAKLSGVSED